MAAQQAALRFFGAGGRPQQARAAVRRCLMGVVIATFGVPTLFYLRFGTVGEIGWGFTIFLDMLCLLIALGITVADKPHLHSVVPLKGDWLDHLGAFWLVACAFGPFAGWLLTESITPNADTWRWQFAGRTLFAIVLPIVTALPLARYARGGAAIIGFALLIGVTALPVASGALTTLDLLNGPIVRQLVLTLNESSQLTCLTLDGGTRDIPCNARAWGGPADTVAVSYLRYTGKLLAVKKLTSTA
jgi:hypothetical protein